jgi:hypothetical protein
MIRGAMVCKKQLATAILAYGTRGKPADANLSADLQIGQSKIGGQKPL